MFRFRRLAAFSMVAAMLSSANFAHAGLVLPDTSLALQYGDMYSFSLPYLDEFFGDFAVQSTPGQISGGVVIATGPSGVPLNTNFSGMDDAYPTPNGAAGDPFFSTVTTADPGTGGGGTAPSVDLATAWDADVAALRDFLTGDFAVFFNLNEEGAPHEVGDDSLESTDLLAWAEFRLTGPEVAPVSFFFSAFDDPFTLADERTPGLLASQVFGGPDETDFTYPGGTGGANFTTLDSRWGFAHSFLTTTADGTLLHFGPKTGDDPADAVEINQNLGADHAAFVVFNPTLSSLINDPSSGYTSLHTEIRLSRLSNGFEQAFLLPDTTVTQTPVVPEPSMLVIGSLLSLGGTVLTRRRNAVALQ